MLNKLRKGQVTIFGKTISVLAAVLTLALLSGVGLALLTAYVTITGTATVGQSVILSDIESTWQTTATTHKTDDATGDYSFSIYAGGIQAVGIQLDNRAPTTAPLQLRVLGTMPTNAVWGTDVVVKLYPGYDTGTEHCTGDPISVNVENGVPVTVTGGVPTGLSWLCLEHDFNLAAIPGSYGFTVTLEP
jgi:hypothetical protein